MVPRMISSRLFLTVRPQFQGVIDGVTLAVVDAERFRDVAFQRIAAEHPARDAVAQQDHVLADRAAIDQVEEGRNAFEFVGRQVITQLTTIKAA